MKNADILKVHQPQPRFPVIQAIQNRFSPRFYTDELVDEKDLQAIFEAARWAPSGHNLQPWKFYFAHQGTAAYQQLFATLAGYNQSWS